MTCKVNYISQDSSVGFGLPPNHMKDRLAGWLLIRIRLTYLHRCLNPSLFALQISMSSFLFFLSFFFLQPLPSSYHLNTHALACGNAGLNPGLYLLLKLYRSTLESIIILFGKSYMYVVIQDD